VIGKRLGAYRIVQEIGRGGMGSFTSPCERMLSIRSVVAIKLIRRGTDNEFIIRRFRNERQILASLDHPNIASLLDGGTTEEGLPYFVMEYVEVTRFSHIVILTNSRSRNVCGFFGRFAQPFSMHISIASFIAT